MTENTDSLLARAELFSRLSSALRAQIVPQLEARSLAEGEWLFREGDAGGFCFLVAEGALEALRLDGAGTLVSLRRLGPGEVGGVTSITTGAGRSASVRATGTARVLTFGRDAMRSLLRSDPSFAEALTAYLGDKVRSKTRQMVEALSGHLPRAPRVAFFDTKPYDRKSFEPRFAPDLAPSFFEAKLGADTASLASGHAIVCAFVNDKLDARVLEALAAEGVGLVALRCAGYNNVDRATAARLGISLVHVPSYSPEAVAEHAVALLLALSRKTHRAYARVREGNFSLAGLVGFNLSGRTAGLLGLGRIGRATATILGGFGMRVLATDKYVQSAPNGVELVTLEQLVAESDVLSLHAPLTPETRHVIDGARIAAMKRGVVIINTSRGALIDTAALIEGLKSCHVGAAGLDVYEEEAEYFFEDRSDVVITDDVLARLMTFPNVLVTSHQGFLTEEALGNIADTTVASMREFVAGKRGRELTRAVP